MRRGERDLEGPATLRPAPARVETAGGHAHAAEAVRDGRLDVLSPADVTHLQQTAGNAAVVARLATEGNLAEEANRTERAATEQTAREPERSPVYDVVGRGGGRALGADVRADMETRLGHDFSDVRVHDDASAHDSAVAVNAHAYTVGSDIVFQRDRYDPGSPAGRLTLAHELTHVVQQRSGPVDGTPAPGGVRISDPGDRFEREAAANAERVMATPSVQVVPSVHLAGAGPLAGAAAVQRDWTAAGIQREEAPGDEVEEEAPVQQMRTDAPVLQREGEDETEDEA